MHLLVGGVICLFGVVSLAVAGEALYRGRIYDHYHRRHPRWFRRSREPLQYWVRTAWFGGVGSFVTGLGVWMVLFRPAFTTAQGGSLGSRRSLWEWTGRDWLIFLVVLVVIVGVSCLWQWLLRRERRARAKRRKEQKPAAQVEDRRRESDGSP